MVEKVLGEGVRGLDQWLSIYGYLEERGFNQWQSCGRGVFSCCLPPEKHLIVGRTDEKKRSSGEERLSQILQRRGRWR